MKSTIQKITSFILILECLFLLGCGFQLRDQNTLPLSLKSLEVVSEKPYDQFTKQLKYKLVLLNNHAPDVKSNTQLIIHQHHLSYRMPIIGSSQQTRIYRYTFLLEYSLMVNNHIVIKHRKITLNKLLTLNENALLTTNNQLELLTVEIQQAAIDQLINELKSPKLASKYDVKISSEDESDELNSINSQEVPNS